MSVLSVKPHPFARFRYLVRSFSARHVHPGLRPLFVGVMFLWRKVFGIESAERLIEQDLADGRDGFWHADWIFDTLFYPEISVSVVMTKCAEVRADVKAAKLIYAALVFRRELLAERIAPDVEAGLTLDMRRYRNFFSRLTLSSYRDRKLTHTVTDVPESDYVVCAIDRRFYKVRVIEEGHIVPYQEIFNRVSQCLSRTLDTADDYSEDIPPFGLLTTLNNATSVSVLQELCQQNPQMIEVLNHALFFVAIDVHDQPQSLERVCRSIQCENFANRDYRRSLQIIVSGNGRSGIIVNPHAGIGGTIMVRVCSEWHLTCQSLPTPTFGVSPTISPEALRLTMNQSQKQDRTLRELQTLVRSKIYRDDKISSFRIQAGGLREFRSRGWSPDGAFHCALNLAYYRMYARPPIVGNFINLRCVKNGDIWRYTSTSPEMVAFVRYPNFQSLQRALAKHRGLVKKGKQADDEFYLGARTLMRLVNNRNVSFFSFVTLMLIMGVFVRDFKRRFLSPDIWISGIPALPGFEFMGRASVMMSYLGKNSIGGHYMVFDDHIKICLLTHDSPKGVYFCASSFARTLEDCVREILRLAPDRGE